MRLRSLKVHGFKSFADATDVTFHDGVTAIVGPNGCGKSNISDAIRWVLGEQRPTAIRGARMEEAIFQGSVQRRPVNRGSVTMTVSNEDGALPVPFEEVEIGRIVYRDGGSDYTINRSQVRLKDVIDLTRDTGLGAGANVIENRMIDTILSDRADERRGLFEEAAGIGKYKDRRKAALAEAFAESKPEIVIHLAAQAGVRYSLEHPEAYASANLTGTFNVLEATREAAPQHLLIASTSSVYGGNTRMPFRETDNTDSPMTLYAATKKAGEAMSHSYAHLWGLPTTCFRFFTVYGPWGRPDMALFLFTGNILRGEPIQVFNHGRHTRDFTYIDDIVDGVVASLDHVPAGDPDFDPLKPRPGTSSAPYRVFNIGNQTPVQLERYIQIIEDKLGRKAEKILLPLQPGDVPDTHADVSDLAAVTGYAPATPVDVGVGRFIDWYRQYYQV